MATEPVRVVDIDLTSLSRASGWASASPALVPLGIMVWCFLLVLIALMSIPLAAVLAFATILLIVFGLFSMVRQRTISSTPGTKTELIVPEHSIPA